MLYNALILAIIFSFIASIRVNSVFNRYNEKSVHCGKNANDVVREIFRVNGISDVPIIQVPGNLTDNYNPSSKTLSLSVTTYGIPSIGAIGVAAHEAGHAVQHSENYGFLNLRSAMVPVVNIGSKFGILIAVLGAFFAGPGSALARFGILLYSLVFFFTLITLPVEFNASRRAISAISDMNCFTDDEIRGMRKVLSAAAMTYVAAMFSALINLLRIISIFGGNNNRRR